MPIFLNKLMMPFMMTDKGERISLDLKTVSLESITVNAPYFGYDSYEAPIDCETIWTATLKGAQIGKKGMIKIIVPELNKYQTRKIIRHLEWWRRYALKTGEKPRDVYQCYLEVTGRAWRPKMPKRR